MKRAPTSPHPANAQRGVTLMLMLVILILGSVTFLVTSLSKATLSLERNRQSSDLLAKSKEAVLGYLVGGGSAHTPGWMSPPDVLDKLSATEKLADGVTQGSNYDGQWEAGCFNTLNAGNTPPYTPLTTTPANMKCLGRLPWKGLGLSLGNTSENDPLGTMPWIAYSSNLMNSTQPINSELLNVTTNWLTVRDMNGNVLSNRVAFLIIIPGTPLAGQTRPLPPSLGGPQQYLDSITVPAGCAAPCQPGTYSNFDLAAHDPFINGFIMGEEHRWIDDPANPGKQIEDSTYQFNDKLLYVTIDELMPLIEKRIAREVKQCLDDYAATSNNKYPWAVPVTDTSNYLSANNTRFGRLPVYPNVFNNNQNVLDLLNALADLQTALNNYSANNTGTTRTQLSTAGNTLKNLTDPPHAPITSTIGNKAENIGDAAKDLAKTPPQDTIGNVQAGINDTLNAMASAGFIANDTSMNFTWPTSCGFFSGSYWDDWKELVFYQLADGYKTGTATPACGTSCLSISGGGNPNQGSGNYRATVIVAGKKVEKSPGNMQVRTNAADKQDRTNYLEGNINPTNKTNAPSGANALNFETYKPSDTANYSTVNDLVLCVDGDINCK